VKPQFEAARAEVSRGSGVISDPQVWRSVLADVGATIAGHGATIMELMASPLRGADGNVEFLLHARAPGGATGPTVPLDQLIDQAMGEVEAG